MCILSNSKIKYSPLIYILFIFLMVGGRAHASVVIDGTRVIYPEEKPEVTVRMTNEGEEAKLVQVWIDNGDKQGSPDQIKVPFVVTTPIFRIEPRKGQAARIQYTRSEQLPSDRESVFWLNVLEIPAKPKADEQDGNYIQFRYRTRIKLFLRPKGLSGTATEAPGELLIKYKPGFVELENPTPFNISMTGLEVGDNSVGGKAESQMIAPFSKVLVELKGQTMPLKTPIVKYTTINDFGGAPVRQKNAVAF
jgi:P pilus assembly chaperone PapD